ncbi:MAG TPA: phage Gp37/Gp68 family protein [Gammaproteobacteria bacterium]|nr:phage Gp37/Gp68 family protein [Gammaproteobacteria bacterium]
MTTLIEWTDETWNPVSGCSRVSQGCKNCYAERMWKRLSAQNMPYAGRDFTNVRCHHDRLTMPLHWRKPRKVFVCSMGDLFHEQVPDGFLLAVFDVIRTCYARDAGHVFQVLTKRPERLLEFCQRLRFDGSGNGGKGRMWLADTPDGGGYRVMGGLGQFGLGNVWLGVSAENQSTADERVPLLMRTPVGLGKRFVSCEPLLGPVDLRALRCTRGMPIDALDPEMPGRRIDWVIAGGESGPRARPMHPYWVRSLRDQCREADAAFFFKQWGTWLPASEDGQGDRGRLLRMTLAGDGESGDRGAWRRTGKTAAGRSLDGEILMEFPV